MEWQHDPPDIWYYEVGKYYVYIMDIENDWYVQQMYKYTEDAPVYQDWVLSGGFMYFRLPVKRHYHAYNREDAFAMGEQWVKDENNT